jgi:hypothetical protein
MAGMSSVKDQAEKKRMSLELDRRNAYGENDKAGRKNIPRGKQRQHQNERRSVVQALRPISADTTEDEIVNAELISKARATASKRKGFRKKPDEPLNAILARKSAGLPRWASVNQKSN